MTQPSNRSDNVIALPKNKSLATRKAFFKEKNLVNYLAWFAASIDCHLFSADLPRFIYVWGSNDEQRDAKMQRLIGRASSELVRRRIEDASALTAEIYASLVDYLDGIGALRVPPFDTSACERATLDNISRKRIEWFLDTARRERGFPLKVNTGTQSLLTHLNLIDDDKPTNAAILLFGDNPQRFHRVAETKCVHCHGTAYRRPFASMQVYGGDLFEQADQARILCWPRSTVPLAPERQVSPHQSPMNCLPMP